MNLTSLLAFLFAIVILVLSAVTTLDDPLKMVDWHGALIVVGGTTAAAALSFNFPELLNLLRVFFQRATGSRKIEIRETIDRIVEFAELYRVQSPQVKSFIEGVKDPFLQESLSGLMDEFVGIEEYLEILEKRAETIYARYSEDATRFKALGKYPPAMGLMGAVLGMIALLGGLGEAGAEKNIGPAMSVALIATFYGIAIANVLIIPIGDNLSQAAREMRTKNLIIIEAIQLIHRRANSIVLREQLNSYLLPKSRLS